MVEEGKVCPLGVVLNRLFFSFNDNTWFDKISPNFTKITVMHCHHAMIITITISTTSKIKFNIKFNTKSHFTNIPANTLPIFSLVMIMISIFMIIVSKL